MQFSGEERLHHLIIMLSLKLWSPPSLEEIAAIKRTLKSLPQLRTTLDCVYKNYAITVSKEDIMHDLGISLNSFWKFVDDLKLPPFFTTTAAGDFVRPFRERDKDLDRCCRYIVYF